MYILGIDPGPIPGIVRLQVDVNRPGENLVANGAYLRGAQAMQITPELIEPVLDMLSSGGRTVVAIERFVVGRRAGRSSAASAGVATRNMVGAVEAWAFRNDVQCIARSAADVKPWATDHRLHAAGLLEPLTTGMRHARDAARHALFCAVKDFGLSDPLSARAGVR